MKNIFILLFLSFCFVGYGQIINFPDANFKNALVNTKCVNLVSLSGNYVSPDINNNGEIEKSEAEKVVRLKLINTNITNLDGLENFSNLIYFESFGNSLDSFTMINNQKMMYLEIKSSKIKKIYLKNCKNLKHLDISNNPILKENIYFNQFDSLTSIYCQQTLIDTFNLNAPKITDLYSSNLKHIEISKYKYLKNLTCTGYQSRNLDLRALMDLEFINCDQSQIEKLNISGLKKMKLMRCFSNKIDSLDLRGMNVLTEINCSRNKLSNIDLSDCISLINITCYSNNLKSLDLSNCIKLERISCYYNNIEFISTKNGVREKSLTIHSIPLKYLCSDDGEIQFYKDYFSTNSNLKDYQIGTYCSFTPGGKFYTIQGNNTYDGNNNGCDDLDIKISNTKFSITNGTITGNFITSSTGKYSIPVQAGTHTITPILEHPEHFEVTPSSFTLTFPTTSDTITQNFCITPKGIFRQTNITVIPLTPPARPGFDASYKIVWENVGNQIESGTLNFTYDETLLDYISATQTADQVADGIIKWNFTNLLPFEKREITVTLKVNRPTDTPAVNAGDKLYLTASILDNIFTLENTVVGSYDPNDKTCLQGDRVKPDMVGEYVDYLIRFENTGNYAAENVVVKDIIDIKTFDVSTLQITDASHEVYTRIEGNKVEFIFENIQLPFDDANNDGYIAFKIKTLPSLVLGDSLKNLADIYFDYNFPIRTNEAQTTIALPSFTKDIATEVNIYPNPVRDILYLESDENWSKAEIFDISGRILRSVTLFGQSLDVIGLESGTYFMRLKDGEKVGVVKFVKM